MGCDETHCVPYIFTFGAEKKHNFQKNENIALLHLRRKKKKYLIYLNSHRYCLYCLNTSKQKWNASVPRLLLSPTQPSFGLVTQRHLFSVGERQRCVTRPNNGCESRLYLLPFLKQRENHNYLSTVSCQKNTIPRYFTSKSKLQFCFISNRTKAKTYCDLEWVKKRIILQRRLLDWFLPIWTLPPVCEIRDKMQVVCKELTHDWAKSTIARS